MTKGDLFANKAVPPVLCTRLYKVLFINNDNPYKIAAGFGLGVFTGVMPGIGPLVALALAALLRVNKASALLGSFITNTWISFLVLLLAFKTGAVLFGVNLQGLRQEWVRLWESFNWAHLCSMSVLRIFIPVITGYLLIAAGCGIVSYAVLLVVIFIFKKMKEIKKRRWFDGNIH